MLKGLIKPDLNSRNPEDRVTAIEKMTEPAEFQAELAACVQNDDASEVRLAALSRLTDPQKLASLITELIDKSGSAGSSEDRLEKALRKQFIEVLQVEPPTSANLQDMLEQSEECCHLIACAAPDESTRTAALSRISNENDLVRVVAEAQHHSARLAAAERVTEPEHLKTCLGKVKNRDKVTARLLQQRLSEHHAGIEKTELHQASVRQITGSMEALSGSVWSPQYAGQYTALQQRWKALDPVPGTDEQQAFTRASEGATAKVEEHKSQLQHLDACQDTLAEIEQSIATLGAAKLASLPETAKSVRQIVEGMPQKWQAANASLSGENLLEPIYQTTFKKLQGLLQHAESIVKAESGAEAKPAAPKADNSAEEIVAVASETEDSSSADDSKAEAAISTDTGADTKVDADAVSKTDSKIDSKAGVKTDTEAESRVKTKTVDKGKVSPVRLHRVIDAALSDDNFAASMSCVPELHERLESVSRMLEKDQHRQVQLVEGVGKQLGALSATITAGKWSTAEGMSNRIARKLEQIEGKGRQPLQARYDAQRKKLDELADWQDFAAKPKLEELVKNMQELPAKSMKPRELADEIKSLQQQWKSIGGCRVANQLWPDFKEAGDTAYAPCKEYFDGLKKQRDARIKNRNNVCKRLEQFISENSPDGAESGADTAAANPDEDASVGKTGIESPEASGSDTDTETETKSDSNAAENEEAASSSAVIPTGDWKAMQRLLSDANREWRNNRVSGRKQDKQLESRFEQAVQKIEDMIAPHFAAGEAERAEIIAKTRKLSEGEINQHAINQAKSLQAAWKLCGPASRKQDRKLWNEFNELNGQIFGKHREEQRAQYKAGMAHVDRAREIVKTIRSLGRKPSDQDERQFQDLQDEFQGLEEFPEKVRRGLVRDFRNACDGFNNKRADIGKKQEREELNSLRNLAVICEQLENGVIDYRDLQENSAANAEAKEKSDSDETKATSSDTAQADLVEETSSDEKVESAAADQAGVEVSTEETKEQKTEEVAREAKEGEPAKVASEVASDDGAGTSAESGSVDTTAADSDDESWLEQWQELGAQLPKPWLKRIVQRRDTAMKLLEKQESPFNDKNNDARRLHCIKLEILRDVDTPAEDKARRMQYQLEQLQSGPDSALKDSGREQLRNYEVDWLCLLPASPDIAATLDQRFRKALGK